MRVLICLVMTILLAACTYPLLAQPDCDVITASALRARIGEETSIEQFKAWISQTYGVSSGAILAARGKGEREIWVVEWQVGGRLYRASLANGKLGGLGVSYEQREPPADRIIACLGTPSLYRTVYERQFTKYHLSLDLVFPNQGILAVGWRFFYPKPEPLPVVNSDFPVKYLTFVRPGSAEQVLHQIFVEGWGDAKRLQEYKPWPGDWQAIEIEIDPQMRQ